MMGYLLADTRHLHISHSLLTQPPLPTALPTDFSLSAGLARGTREPILILAHIESQAGGR